MTNRQIKWAESHDWFKKDNGNGTVTVEEVMQDRDGKVTSSVEVFGNFNALREWAGY